MFYALHSQGQRACQAFAMLVFLIMGCVAMAQVTTSGCSSQTSCTGEELIAGGEFTVDGVRFFNFANAIGVFGEPSVRYTPDVSFSPDPFDLRPQTGFLVTRDNSMPLYRAAGIIVDADDSIQFDVESSNNRRILERFLIAHIGDLYETSDVYGLVGAWTEWNEDELRVTCENSAWCYDETRWSADGLGSHLGAPGYPYALLTNELGVIAIIDPFPPDNPNLQYAVAELANVAFRLYVEPSNDVQIDILSGDDWLSHNVDFAGWQTVTFDDSAWVPARAPYPSPATPMDLIPGTEAQFMWFDPQMTSDGSTGPVRSWYRYPFHIDLPGATSPGSAIVTASVDDDYDLYVNGTLVFENHDNGFGNVVDTIDIASHLQDGDNLIAIYAVDGGWINPRPRGFERVLFDADITLPRFAQPIRSNRYWLSSDTEVSGWQDVEFNDDEWVNARHYPSPTPTQTLIQDSLAKHIWHDPDWTSDGSTGPIEAFFRHKFFVPFDPATYPVFAKARISVDDDYDFYVNGVLVHQNNDGGYGNVVDTIDFTDALRQGVNVIAIRGADGSGDFPYPRGYERLLFEGLVATGDLGFANDADGDEIHDFADNCIESYNPAQTDSNGDGYGNTCDPDLNDDGIVNYVDLGMLRQVFLGSDEDADFNHDGAVNAGDLGIMKQLFFHPPGPSAVAPQAR